MKNQATENIPVGMIEAPNGEIYYPLSEDAYNYLNRANGALSALAELLWATSIHGAAPSAESIGDSVGMASETLHKVIETVLSEKLNHPSK